MKKIALCIAALAILSLMTACSKNEGVYSPKKKIASVYESSTYIYSWQNGTDGVWYNDTNSSPKTLSEEWNWDGNKLSKITFYEVANVTYKGEVSDVVSFIYDGDQVTRIEGYDEYITLSYDGSKLKQAQLFETEDNALEASFDFVHDGKKIVKINITSDGDIFDMKTSVQHLEKVLFRGILPSLDQADRVVAVMSKVMKNNDSKAQMTISMGLTWTGDNVTGISMNYMGMDVTGTYTFDNKNNPYQNFLLGLVGMEDNGAMVIFNKNNVIKSVMKMQMSFAGQSYIETEEENYSYTYDGDWPLTQTRTSPYGNEEEGYTSVSETVTYFEYK